MNEENKASRVNFNQIFGQALFGEALVQYEAGCTNERKYIKRGSCSRNYCMDLLCSSAAPAEEKNCPLGDKC